jgi:hypothetical protein
LILAGDIFIDAQNSVSMHCTGIYWHLLSARLDTTRCKLELDRVPALEELCLLEE